MRTSHSNLKSDRELRDMMLGVLCLDAVQVCPARVGSFCHIFFLSCLMRAGVSSSRW